ncbi:sigma-70 family RNA polymerase sigma factor [Paenibacillus gansuensis]|uniref:Sigma-70 family RNA polymerase sigma factor n=1 Tax=Paenibacillus gansuensis TaxID=306542 RepID=A0ABW5PE67_9BACL
MEDMVKGYKWTRRNLQALRTLNTDKAERQIIGEMISDCNYTLEWLQSGRRPGNRRGIERRAAYQREKLMDPVRMQAFVSGSTTGSPANLSEWERFRIDDALSRLSERERECYVLAHGHCFSHYEISQMLNITKGSVDSYIQRAQRKISRELIQNIFLSG